MIPYIPFPLEKLQLTALFTDANELEMIRKSSSAQASLGKVKAAYHDLYFPEPPEDRPYTFASIVLSIDGKMAFPDNPQGPVVAKANRFDPEGALADFWILNLLRAHADAIIVGAKILQVEPDAIFACHDKVLLEERRTVLGKTPEVPLTVITSLDGTDVPFNHTIFSVDEERVMINTCRMGGDYLNNQYPQDVELIGPFMEKKEVDGTVLKDQIQSALDAGKKPILMTGDATPDERMLLYCLRKIGIRHLEVESPTYMWLLMNHAMLDEFFVNYSPLFIGGPITPGYGLAFTERQHPHAKFLVIAMHNNRFLYTRQKLIYGL